MELDEEKLMEAVVKASGISREEIEKKVNEKLEEFGGMVSREGAIIIVGKELGVDLVKTKPKLLKIKNIVPGLNRVNVVGKVLRIYPPKEFDHTDRENGRKGSVANMILGDETGIIRVSVWNEKVDMLKNIEEGDVVEITNGYTKEDEFVGVELRIGGLGSVRKLDDVSIEVKDVDLKLPRERKYREVSTLVQLKEGEPVMFRACIGYIFDKQILHYLCPTCYEKLDASMKCSTHKEVEPDRFLVISGVLDDGYDAKNFVAFRKSVEKLLGMNAKEVEEKIRSMGEGKFKEDFVFSLVGKEFVFKGIVKKSAFSDELEINVSDVESVMVKPVLKKSLGEVEVV